MGQRARGLHYKKQIKGLPLIRCQGQRGGFACLGHDTISVNLLRSWIKRNQSIDRKNRKRGMGTGKNRKQEQRGKGVRVGYRDWRMDERGGMKKICLCST